MDTLHTFKRHVQFEVIKIRDTVNPHLRGILPLRKSIKRKHIVMYVCMHKRTPDSRPSQALP